MKLFDSEMNPLPNCAGMEAALLGSILLDPSRLEEAVEVLQPAMFYGTVFKRIYQGMLRMREAGEGIDIATLTQHMDATDRDEEITWQDRVCSLMEDTATSPDITQYLRGIVETFARRELWEECERLKKRVLNQELPLGGCLEDAEQIGDRLAGRLETAKTPHVAIAKIVRFDPESADDEDVVQPDIGTSTGWTCLDKLIRLGKGTTTIVTGIPNDGKSVFVNQLMVQTASQSGWKWGVYSPESFPFRKYSRKMIEMVSSKEADTMTSEHRRSTLEWLRDHFVVIDSGENGLSISKWIRMARDEVARHGLNGLLIDPWNWMKLDHKYFQTREGMSEILGNVLTDLVGFALRMQVAQVIVAHPPKQTKNSAGKYPIVTGYDLHGSASFFNKPMNGVTVYRDEGFTKIVTWKIKEQPHQGTLGTAYLKYQAPGLLVDHEDQRPRDVNGF